MRRTLSILNSTGDTKITWDQADPAACADARKTVADLAAAGYTFFLTDGTAADAVTAGGGTLLVRRLDTDEVVAAPTVEPRPAVPETPRPEPPDLSTTPPKRRGRPPKNAAAPQAPADSVIAVRPVRGG